MTLGCSFCPAVAGLEGLLLFLACDYLAGQMWQMWLMASVGQNFITCHGH